QLALVFYTKKHKPFAASDQRLACHANERIGDIRKNHNRGALEIKTWHTVAKVEKELRDLYGLNAQVFRISADGSSVQTTRSDELTLKQQSDLAIEGGFGSGPAI
ncbi:MAG TPA: hypothetical protein VFL47_04885, partial [Flavisolibacter sp.]|nr:hypothetical protein [Flavisolibacter sp.]